MISKPSRTLGRRIEFVGLCGAGKSTFSQLLASHLDFAANGIVEMRASDVPAAPSIAAGLGVAARMVANESGSLRFLGRSANWWLPLKMGYRSTQLVRQAGRIGGSWTLCVDSGLLQPYISFAAEYNKRLDPVVMAQVAKVVSLPDTVVHVSASAVVALERYLKRSAGSPTKSQRAQFLRQFQLAVTVEEKLLSQCIEHGVTVLKVRADETKSSAAAMRIASAIRERLSGKGE